MRSLFSAVEDLPTFISFERILRISDSFGNPLFVDYTQICLYGSCDSSLPFIYSIFTVSVTFKIAMIILGFSRPFSDVCLSLET